MNPEVQHNIAVPQVPKSQHAWMTFVSAGRLVKHLQLNWSSHISNIAPSRQVCVCVCHNSYDARQNCWLVVPIKMKRSLSLSHESLPMVTIHQLIQALISDSQSCPPSSQNSNQDSVAPIPADLVHTSHRPLRYSTPLQDDVVAHLNDSVLEYRLLLECIPVLQVAIYPSTCSLTSLPSTIETETGWNHCITFL